MLVDLIFQSCPFSLVYLNSVEEGVVFLYPFLLATSENFWRLWLFFDRLIVINVEQFRALFRIYQASRTVPNWESFFEFVSLIVDNRLLFVKVSLLGSSFVKIFPAFVLDLHYRFKGNDAQVDQE